MSHGTHDAGVRLRRQIRAQLRDGQDTITLSKSEAELLVDEVGRLQQANDRLRRQNKRLRKRLLAEGGAGMEELDTDAEADEGDATSADEDGDV